jgi:hypothetical protein
LWDLGLSADTFVGLFLESSLYPKNTWTFDFTLSTPAKPVQAGLREAAQTDGRGGDRWSAATRWAEWVQHRR